MSLLRRILSGPRPKALFGLLIVGVAGVGLAVFATWQSKNQEMIHVLLEVSAAALILGFVELLIKLFEVELESRDIDAFKSLFGCGVFSGHGETQVVFPSAKPSRRLADAKQLVGARLAAHAGPPYGVADAGMDAPLSRPPAHFHDDGPCALEFPHAPEKAQRAKGRAKGVKYVVPFEDLQGAMAVVQLFESVGAPLRMVLDDSFANAVNPLPPQTLIAFGLGFNNVTDRLSDLCPLFEVFFAGEDDDFVVGKDPHGFPKDGWDCALLARVVEPEAGNPVAYFVCAGRTAEGTQAAGTYLGKHWKELLAMYKRAQKDPQRNSMALVLKFRHRVPHRAVPAGPARFT